MNKKEYTLMVFENTEENIKKLKSMYKKDGAVIIAELTDKGLDMVDSLLTEQYE